MTADNSPWLQFLLLGLLLILAILFLLTQQNTLKAILPENRLMNPGLVWLELIPVFGQCWQFLVAARIAGSIRKELEFRQEDTILGLSDASAIGREGRRPTYVIGITYCTLNVIGILLNMFLTIGPGSLLLLFPALIILGGVICWIVYWVRLAGAKRELLLASPAKF
jgi:hypothetical protein